jgi:hypothetical protein
MSDDAIPYPRSSIIDFLMSFMRNSIFSLFSLLTPDTFSNRRR